jgi:NADH:ubiquinone oxidoreductase subunit 3 (subunit A)
MDFFLYPPVAFGINIILAGILLAFGRFLAGSRKSNESNEMKTSSYTSGESAPTGQSAPGYKQFFVIALFFAVLHLGVLMIGSGGLNWLTGVYLTSLVLILIALILG